MEPTRGAQDGPSSGDPAPFSRGSSVVPPVKVGEAVKAGEQAKAG